ncbi:ABC transporter permease subunit [Myxococcus qinghaiensis]|uniref:ABC transporter permease subunit n=1 Tax=Myxococcus qinghaiensis TaxID=2906758 RepID=UPI0020A7592B|nr:ABC transporter permease subunit [Myxococcus qinghaiensis]MCP3167478.1 ABC transporter permease subunit [Myxococcus qinghaiensis]
MSRRRLSCRQPHTPGLGLLCLAWGLAVLLGCGRGEAPGSGGDWKGRTLRIGTDATYPPFESVKDGELVGFDIELGALVAEELGAKVSWTNTSFDGVFPALMAGKFDLVISAVTLTPERQQRLGFSAPYYTAGQLVVAREADTAVTGLESLRGKTAGIQINTSASLVLEKFPDIEVRQYPSIDLALQDLRNGNLAGVVGDGPTLRYFLTHGFQGLRAAGGLLTEEHYGIAMRPDEPALREAVNAALQRLRDSGKFAALEERYFGEAAQKAQATPQAVPWGKVTWRLAQGLGLTLGLTVLALVSGMPLGLAVALGRRVRFRPLSWLCAAYVEGLRGTPLLVQIIFIYYALPQLLGVDLAPMLAAVLALTLNSAAYVAEIFRAGIASVDAGQEEAARALGMGRAQVMRYVILPQAVRNVLPPLTNEGIALLKDSSLVSIIGMAELTRAGQELASQLAAPLAVWPLVALFYLLATLPLTRLASALEKRLHRQG